MSADINSKVIEVVRDSSAKIPSFEPLGREGVSDEFANAMYEVLRGGDTPAYLDEVGKTLLVEGRGVFSVHGLETKRFWEEPAGTSVLTWTGTKTNAMLALMLVYLGFEASAEDIGVSVVGCSKAGLRAALERISVDPPLASAVVKVVPDIQTAKYDALVPHDVLESQWVKENRASFAAALVIAGKILIESASDRTFQDT